MSETIPYPSEFSTDSIPFLFIEFTESAWNQNRTLIRKLKRDLALESMSKVLKNKYQIN